jgi:hypothetical protein
MRAKRASEDVQSTETRMDSSLNPKRKLGISHHNNRANIHNKECCISDAIEAA